MSAYCGLTGQGKSYGAVENVIIPALKDKRLVFTNIPMNKDLCIERYQMAVVQFVIQDIVDNPEWFTEVFEPGSIFVCDEVWELWPAGLNAKSALLQHKTFLAKHRHLVGDNGRSTEIVLLTQDLSQIANFVRILVDSTFRSTKLTNLGLEKNYRIDVYFGPVTGVTPPATKREREIQGTFKKDVYALYKSHTESAVGAGDETRTDKRFQVFGKTSIKLGFMLFVCLLISLYYSASHVKQKFYPSAETESLEPASTRRVVSSARAVADPVVVEEKTSEFEFMSYFSDSFIAYNNGVYPNIDYRISLQKGNFYASVTISDLKDLGYKITPINSCLIRYVGSDTSGVITCKRDAEESFVTQTFSGITGS